MQPVRLIFVANVPAARRPTLARPTNLPCLRTWAFQRTVAKGVKMIDRGVTKRQLDEHSMKQSRKRWSAPRNPRYRCVRQRSCPDGQLFRSPKAAMTLCKKIHVLMFSVTSMIRVRPCCTAGIPVQIPPRYQKNTSNMTESALYMFFIRLLFAST